MNSQAMKIQPMQHQRGITLIESLVALLVAALGIMGIVGVQMRTLADTQTSMRRAQAIRLIEDLGERMKVHPNALSQLNSGLTLSGFNNWPAPGSCNSGCDMGALIAHDIATWKDSVKNHLPGGDASIFFAPNEVSADNKRLLGVIVAWRENERHDADATLLAIDDAADGTTDATNECPDDYTCHLQYIPVAGRCAPYFTGGTSTAKYFCPGS